MNQNYALTPQKYLSVEEQRHLVELLEKHREKDLRNTTMLLLMLQAGLRPGEVCNLVWSDIDESSLTIRVETLKGGPNRIVPISRAMITRLHGLGPIIPDQRIFNIRYHRFLDIWKLYRPAPKKLHSLRHTFAVNMYNKSRHNLSLVQQALGHSSITTTAIYLQIQSSISEMRQAMF